MPLVSPAPAAQGYAARPHRHPIGLGIVLVLHLLLGWAMVSGLARKVVEVVKAPIETKIIEEVKPPPPPPPEKLPPPPPKSLPPPPAFAPPPEVQVNQPQPQQTITTTQVQPPPAEVRPSTAPAVVSAPRAPPAPPAPPARTAPRISFNDGNKPEYPAAARRAEIQCDVTVAYTMETDGSVADAKIERSCGPSKEARQLDRATLDAVLATRGTPGTVEGKPERSSGRVLYVWKLE